MTATANPKSKKGRGRPNWKPTKAILNKAEELGALGLKQDEIAHCLGIKPTTLYYKKIEYPELEHAIGRGKAMGVETASRVLYELVKEGNMDAIKTFLKLCHQKSEKFETELSGSIETNSKVEWLVQPIIPANIQTQE